MYVVCGVCTRNVFIPQTQDRESLQKARAASYKRKYKRGLTGRE